MIGKQTLIIDASDFIKGMSSSPDVTDGGFSNETDNVNLTATPGALYAPAIGVDSDTDTRLTGNAIASSPDMNVTSPTNRLVVTDDGKGYRYNGTKLTAAGIALTAGKTWATGFTDIITFGGEAYVSSKESLTRWQNDNTIDAGASWAFSFTNSDVPHPGLVYENNMYWADKNLLLIQSSVGDAVAPTTILTLSADQVIIALGIDPGTGLMLISTTNALDISATLTSINKLLWYDGNSAKVTKAVIVEDTILGFHSNSGVVLVGYGKKLGYVNGSGISFLRNLKNVTSTASELPYKHHFASVGNTAYILDGLQILAYGEVLPGRKSFYYAFKNSVNSNKFTMLGNGGAGKLVFGFATTKFYSFDTTSVATTNGLSLYSNKYAFPRPVYLRSVYIEYANAVVNNNDTRYMTYNYQEQLAGFVNKLYIQGQAQTTLGLKNLTGASITVIDNIIGFTPNKVTLLQLLYVATTTNNGIRRIIIRYDVAE